MMKNIFYACVGVLLIFASACEPIEDRKSLAPAISEGELDNSVSVTVDGNTIKCTSTATGVFFWQTNSGKQSNQKDAEFYVPLARTVEVTCTLFGGTDKVTVKKTVEVAQNDPEYYSSPLWKNLTNNAEGKTWVWATDKPGATIWSVSPWHTERGIVDGLSGWWGQNFPDLSGQGTSPDDEMYFDLNLAHNYTLTQPGAGARPGSGSGSFDMNLNEDNMLLWSDDNSVFSYGTITFTNSTIPIASNDGNPYVYTYDILELTEDELVLAYPTGDREGVEGQSSGCWVYQFKRKGFTY